MIWEMWNLFLERSDFFADLLWEHLGISLLAIVIAVLIGGSTFRWKFVEWGKN